MEESIFKESKDIDLSQVQELDDILQKSGIRPIDIRAQLFKQGDFDFIVRGKNEYGDIVEHIKQREALSILTSNKYEELLYGGAAGGAKSFTGASWLLFMCINYPGTRWFIARNEIKDIVDSVLVTFNKVCREYGFTGYKYNAVKNFIQFDNGSFINLIEVKYKPSDPMFEDLGSTEYTGGWIEEVGEIHKMAYEVLSTRIGRHLNGKYGLKKMLFLTCNPKKNWAKTEFYDKDKNGTLESYKKYLSCLVTENPFIEEAYVESLRRMALTNKALYERLFKGNWDYEDNPNALCDYEMIEQVFDNDHVPEGRKVYLTADIARLGSDKAVIFVWKGWKVIDKVVYDISKTTDIQLAINILRRKYRIPKNRCVGDSDGVGCLERGTEVMTINGWKLAEEITTDDLLMSKNEHGFKEYRKPFEVIHHEQERFTRINDNLAFTNTHIHFYKTRKEYKIQSCYWDDLVEKSSFYSDVSVNNTFKDSDFVIESTKKEMPNGGVQNFKNEFKASRIDFCRFLGWLLSDGHIDNYNNKNVIAITQSVNSPNNDHIVETLDKLGVKWRVQTNERLHKYSFQHKGLMNWIQKECYSGFPYDFKTKKIPFLLRNVSKECFMAFCDSFVRGDGYYHKDKMIFTGTNKNLLDGIQECLFLNGIKANIHVKHKKGSVGYIDGREIIRQRDCYVMNEVSSNSVITKIKKKEVFWGEAINIRIPNKTRAILIRVNGDIFWTHNGGVIDNTGITGFINNASPVKENRMQQNYKNLQVQCLYHLADKVNDGALWIACDLSNDEKEKIKEELDQIQSKIHLSGKLDCKHKDDIKKDIGRSPDYRDALLMRVIFDLKPPKRNLVRRISG